MIILYAASTLYHWFTEGKLKYVLEICDHSAIYVLIAGTYTPFLLLVIRGMVGWLLFIIIWSIALGGIVFKIFWIKRFQILSLVLYLIMGWLIIFVIKPLYRNLNSVSLILLFAGGVLYSVGTIFFMKRSIPYNHVIWHVFVLAASVCHYLSVYFIIVFSPI